MTPLERQQFAISIKFLDEDCIVLSINTSLTRFHLYTLLEESRDGDALRERSYAVLSPSEVAEECVERDS